MMLQCSRYIFIRVVIFWKNFPTKFFTDRPTDSYFQSGNDTKWRYLWLSPYIHSTLHACSTFSCIAGSNYKKVVVGCDLSNGKIGRGYPKSDDPTVFIVWRNWIQYVKFSHSGHSSLICSITSFLELVTSSHFHLTACPNYAVKKFRTNKLFKYVKVSLSMVTNDTISGPL